MIQKNFTKISLSALAMAAAVAYAPVSNAALTYSQNWEGNAADWNTNAAAISDDGWTIGQINHTTGGEWFAGFAAPNNAADGNNGFSSLATGEGSPAQGAVQLSIYADYNGWGPWVANPSHVIQSFVNNDLGIITGDMVGNTYSFDFDGKLGNLDANVAQADAFMKVLKVSDSSYFELFNSSFDSDANLTTDWSGGSIGITIDAGMVGELLQIGFTNTTDNWNPTGVFYDNLNFNAPAVPVPAAVWLFGSGLLGLVGVARRKRMS